MSIKELDDAVWDLVDKAKEMTELNKGSYNKWEKAYDAYSKAKGVYVDHLSMLLKEEKS